MPDDATFLPFDLSAIEPDDSGPDPERIVKGQPRTRTWLVEERGVDEAVRVFRAARAADAGAIVFERDRLLKFGPAWGPERGGDLEKLLRLNLEVYPDSAPSHFWLAQVCLARDDPTAAVGELETALRLDPGYERAQRLLRQLTTPSAR